MRLLLHVIAGSVPFKPNISKLSERTGVTRNMLINFLKYLEDMRITRGLYASNKGISLLQKPEKLFLHHPNLHFALADRDSDAGSMRESFFVNQLGAILPITYAEAGDFGIGERIFEIGGKDKTGKQVKHLENAYLAVDDIEIGHQHRIPLWLFGFLY